MLSYIDKRDSSGVLADPKVTIADLLGGMYAATAIASALNYQAVTGKGCRIEIAMYDALVSWFHAFGLYQLNFGTDRDPRKRMLWGAFKTKDRSIIVAGHRNGPFKKLCRALGREDWLADDRFSTGGKRGENSELLKCMVEEELLRRDSAEWLRIFEAEGVPYAEVCEMADVLRNAQTLARNMVVTAEHPSYGQVKLLGNPIKAEGFEDSFVPPPLSGEHTGDVLCQMLGYSEEKLAGLRARGVVS